ncbi:MAG: hypothetical protein SGI73_10195 [Chloroflexota bacterium]|nr:hypothetical protein [Chloroflexota bacterium]
MMSTTNAPTPVLRIVMTRALHPHEETDSQRLQPLVERIQSEPTMINPPIVAPISDTEYVVLDGANRSNAFALLDYPHILIQVVSYAAGTVELDTWQHVVCNWSADALIEHLVDLPNVEILYGHHADALAHVTCRDGRLLALRAHTQDNHERSAVLRQIVAVYQRSAILQRTALSDPAQVWETFQDGAALIVFPAYRPDDIIAAAQQRAYLPPGISRHIVHGRALRVNYPLDALRDPTPTLEQKNAALQHWLHDKIAKRQMRYYAETTYQFDE